MTTAPPTNPETELVDELVDTNREKRMHAHRCIRLQMLVLTVNTELLLLAAFAAPNALGFWLSSVTAFFNGVGGIRLVREHYVAYLRVRAILIDSETELGIVVTQRKLDWRDAMIGGGLLMGAMIVYCLIAARQAYITNITL